MIQMNAKGFLKNTKFSNMNKENKKFYVKININEN